MTVDLTKPIRAALSKFGQPFTFSPPSPAPDQTIIGILDSGIELEDVVPGDSSTYARLTVDATGLTPAPIPGDEISNTTSVYKIARLEAQPDGCLMLLLRYDRAVT